MTEILRPHLVHRDWLSDPALMKVMALLNGEGTITHIVGGAVRNALLGEKIGDIDLATTALPSEVISLAQEADFKAIPTGIDHGTVTLVVDNQAFEVTTLRADIQTDGRHAKVSFGNNFEEDARRRDFTMNALYIDVDGAIHDPLSGFVDIVHRDVKFIGDAKKRIQEDYLRILRFFRFFAWYGDGRPDRDALKAIVRNKSALADLSVERVWHEFYKILQAPEAERAILWMRTTEVLNVILPENWGLDQFHWLLQLEREKDFRPDPLLRLQAMLRPSGNVVRAVCDRLKLSNKDRERLKDWADMSGTLSDFYRMEREDFVKKLYSMKRQPLLDCMRHEYAKKLVKQDEDAEAFYELFSFVKNWETPIFPLKGQDLINYGLKAGPGLGMQLKKLEADWVESGFSFTKQELLDSLSSS